MPKNRPWRSLGLVGSCRQGPSTVLPAYINANVDVDVDVDVNVNVNVNVNEDGGGSNPTITPWRMNFHARNTM
jgi:hypothetical protein